MDENQLIEHIAKAIDGDQLSLAALFNDYKNAVYCFLTNYIDNQSDIEDVVQETFINAFESLDKLENPLKFRNWIFTISYRRAMDFYRARKTIKTLKVVEDESALENLEEDNAEFIPSEIMETEETRQYIADLVKRLPEDQKTTVLFYYYQQMSVSEIAEAMECSTGTVKSRLNYARKFIKEEIAKQTKKGHKVIAVVPLPLLTQILLWQAEKTKLTASASDSIWNGVESSLNLTTVAVGSSKIVATGAETATKTTVGTAKIAGVTVTAKLVAIIGSIIAVVAVVAVVKLSQTEKKPIVATITNGAPSNITTTNESDGISIRGKEIAQSESSSIEIETPQTKAEYAKFYYQYVQEILMKDPEFRDAELIEGVNGVYGLVTLYSNDEEYNCGECNFKNAKESLIKGVPEGAKYSSHFKKTPPNIGKYFTDKIYLIEYEGIQTEFQEYRHVYGDITDTGINICQFTSLEGLDLRGRYAYDESKASAPISTWGIGHGDTDFTKGERLKAYFE